MRLDLPPHGRPQKTKRLATLCCRHVAANTRADKRRNTREATGREKTTRIASVEILGMRIHPPTFRRRTSLRMHRVGRMRSVQGGARFEKELGMRRCYVYPESGICILTQGKVPTTFTTWENSATLRSVRLCMSSFLLADVRKHKLRALVIVDVQFLGDDAVAPVVEREE